MTDTAADTQLFTEFERDPNAESGVMFEEFITAVGVYVYCNEGEFAVSIADVASAFNTTAELVREAVDDHPWLFRSQDEDPARDLIDSDGE